MSRKDATRVSLAYRYHNPQWDVTRNRQVYGENHSEDGVGGNLTIWLESRAEVSGSNALVIPEKSLQPVLADLKSRLDHRCLFEVESWFESRVPTLENIAVFLGEQIVGVDWVSLTVEENENWSVQIFKSGRRPRLTYTSSNDFHKLSATVEGEIDSDSGLLIARETVVNAVKNQTPEKLLKSFPLLVALRYQNPANTAKEWHSLSR